MSILSEQVKEIMSPQEAVGFLKLQEYAVSDFIEKHFKFPFEKGLRWYQKYAVDTLSPLKRAGYYLDVGVGKTAAATASCLLKIMKCGVEDVVVVMPPILLDGWYSFLSNVVCIGSGQPLSVKIYRGTPSERKKTKLDSQFLLVSMPIFKKDYDKFVERYEGRRRALIVDEATSIKSSVSANHKFVEDFTGDQHLLLLTGTPLTTPLDAYAYVKLIGNGIYSDLRHFERCHVDERDFFKNPVKWKNLDKLNEAMRFGAVRLLRQDVLEDLPECQMTPMYYQIDPKHKELYKQIAYSQLLELKDKTIDLQQVNAVIHALQQVIVNWGYFSDDDKVKPKGLELIEEVLNELGSRKLIIFSEYRMTNAYLVKTLKPYGAVAVYGGISPSKKLENIEKFKQDSKCRVLVAHTGSLGWGVDGLQHVCTDMLFIETPKTPSETTQAIARLWRSGQKEKVHVRIATAVGTLQVRKLDALMRKDDLVSCVQRNYKDLRNMLFGE